MTPRETLIALMPEMETSMIDAWLKKLERAGRDPEMYADALVAKSKRLDGCDGFFVKMHRENHEDEWMDSELKRARRRAASKLDKQWPYPMGTPGCLECDGQGWYAIPMSRLDLEHDVAYDAHQNNGFEPIMYGGQQGMPRCVFICRSCNPNGAMLDKFQSRVLPRYPVFGAPFSL